MKCMARLRVSRDTKESVWSEDFTEEFQSFDDMMVVKEKKGKREIE